MRAINFYRYKIYKKAIKNSCKTDFSDKRIRSQRERLTICSIECYTWGHCTSLERLPSFSLEYFMTNHAAFKLPTPWSRSKADGMTRLAAGPNIANSWQRYCCQLPVVTELYIPLEHTWLCDIGVSRSCAKLSEGLRSFIE